MSTIFANISGIAALAIIAGGFLGLATQLVAGVIGRPLDVSTQDLIDRLISVLVGLAIGSTAIGIPLSNRIARANEVIAQLATQVHSASYPPPPPRIDPKQYPTGG